MFTSHSLMIAGARVMNSVHFMSGNCTVEWISLQYCLITNCSLHCSVSRQVPHQQQDPMVLGVKLERFSASTVDKSGKETYAAAQPDFLNKVSSLQDSIMRLESVTQMSMCAFFLW